MTLRRILLLLCVVLVTQFVSGFVLADEQPRPNILFLLTDDQRFDDLGCMGNQIIQTPNLDQLASNGVIFNNAFVTTAICCSSRASILTGQHMRRHKIVEFSTPLSSEAMDASYPVLLRNSGYRTGFLGKMAIGNPSNGLRRLSLPEDKFDFWFGFPQSISFRQKVDGEDRFLTTLLADKAIEFLRTTPSSQPFCLSISFKTPHGPFGFFDPETPDPYRDTEIPSPASYTRKNFEAHPEFLRESLNGNGEWPSNADQELLQKARICYRLITGMDAAVGRIMATLKELGMDDNTIVIFTSDHGALRGDHGLTGKWLMYEESIRVPLIVCDPRLPHELRGTRREQMVLNIDIAPTLLSMGSVEVPSVMQGRDFAPFLRDAAIEGRREWFYEHTYNTKRPRRPIAKSEGVRTERWKYIRYTEHDPPYEQLFDLTRDPGEQRNLASVPAHTDVLTDMRARCERLGQEAR
ncbi:sulfatase family protein [Novipirellula artificiosorum]|uniref:Arylsulfatase n=1 Tax=Novipirellula artificiosorum TaxID=2528016 RepID=A0A5C6D8G6_9BACT|nr:sulfatase [Novipirellula artificiosorum]TWU33232.1 Arylsulfatase [Novipirellula artificiosorum]